MIAEPDFPVTYCPPGKRAMIVVLALWCFPALADDRLCPQGLGSPDCPVYGDRMLAPIELGVERNCFYGQRSDGGCAAQPSRCQQMNRDKLSLARDACFVVKESNDPATKQACSRLRQAENAEFECEARQAVQDVLGDRP